MENRNYPNAANLNADTEFPYFIRNAENQIFSAGDVGFGVLHWHEDLQFIYVLEGVVCVKTLEEKEIISTGEGMFTNKSVIHYSVGRSNPCRYTLFRFPERFVSFYMGSPAEKLTHAVTDNPSVSLVPLFSSVKWCAEALLLLQRLVQLENEKEENPLYPYDVLTELAKLWRIFLRNINIPERLPENVTSLRMRDFLTFIEKHYAEDITLEALSASAGVSKTEALRCFRQTLQTTPYRYLMDYRLSKAANLLTETDLPIGEIAELAGFHQQSYFGKCFKEKTGISPSIFRRRKSISKVDLSTSADLYLR